MKDKGFSKGLAGGGEEVSYFAQQWSRVELPSQCRGRRKPHPWPGCMNAEGWRHSSGDERHSVFTLLLSPSFIFTCRLDSDVATLVLRRKDAISLIHPSHVDLKCPLPHGLSCLLWKAKHRVEAVNWRQTLQNGQTLKVFSSVE